MTNVIVETPNGTTIRVPDFHNLRNALDYLRLLRDDQNDSRIAWQHAHVEWRKGYDRTTQWLHLTPADLT